MASILLVTSDLARSSQVSGAAARVGATIETVMQPARLLERLENADCRLVILDLNTPGVDPASLVPLIRGQSAAVGIVAFGPHVHEAKLQAAVQAGCDEVLTRGQFHARVDELLRRYVAS